ncbi:MAG: nicotinate-nucleotide adenylyltransferase [Pseudomonadota bacterium]
MAAPIGIFGGTFDPIHYGHLRSAFELKSALRLAQMRFVPCGDPPHRERTGADARSRVAMVRAAVEREPGFVVDDRELKRDGPSYTVDTLESLRAERPDTPLCLIVGMDAFLGLPTWYRWQRVLELAHVVVAHRPGWQAPDSGPLGSLIAECGTDCADRLHDNLAGSVLDHSVTQLEISSSAIRALIRRGDDPRFLVPDAVRNLLVETGCYTAAVTLQ